MTHTWKKDMDALAAMKLVTRDEMRMLRMIYTDFVYSDRRGYRVAEAVRILKQSQPELLFFARDNLIQTAIAMLNIVTDGIGRIAFKDLNTHEIIPFSEHESILGDRQREDEVTLIYVKD